jgi:osomolarity two-component system, sensor histidine kinase NIK1
LLLKELISFYKRGIGILINCGVDPDDSLELKLKKQVFTLLPLMIGVAAIAWGSIYLLLGYHLSASIPLSYSLISAFSLLYFSRTKDIVFLRYSQLTLVLVLPFLLMWSLGGFAAGSYVMIWAFYAPLTSMSFSKKNSIIWISLFMLLTLISFILDSTLSQSVEALPAVAINIFSLLNITTGFGGIFYIMYHYIKERDFISEEHNKNEIKLCEAKELAEQANDAKSTFLANMSHEIRTPLNAILGFVDILMEEEINKDKLNYLKTINQSSQSLLGVINDILDFSKIENRQLKISNIDFNPTEEFESISALFCAKAEEKQLCFNTSIDANIPNTINCDPLRIKQVLSNLLSNAIKFSNERGMVELNISYLKDTNKIRFSVKDNGIGISKEYIKDLFTPFTQEQLSTTRNYGGTGLGLTISSQLVSLLGSNLEVKSKEGEGSEFYFELDVKNTLRIDSDKLDKTEENLFKSLKINTAFSKGNWHKQSTIKYYLTSLGIVNIYNIDSINIDKLDDINILILDSKLFDEDLVQKILDKDIAVIVVKAGLTNSLILKLKGKIKELGCPVIISDLHDSILELYSNKTIETRQIDEYFKNISLTDKKILLVEDNLSNQLFMKVIFKKIKINYDIANDGLEAIQAFKENKYDVILMDENMPNMGGIEAVENILKIEKERKLEHTPIIALTANAIIGDKNRFLNAGMDEYLSKPLDRKNFIKILHDLL